MALGAGLGVDQTVASVAQAIPGLSDAYLMQIAEKGGGWVVLLIVLFFYRRDYQRLTTSENDMRKEFIDAVTHQADAERQLAVALAENSALVQQVLRLVTEDFKR
jgi:hypothetical protein